MHSLNQPLQDESIEFSKAITSWLAGQASILHPNVGSYGKLADVFLMGGTLEEGVAFILRYRKALELKVQGLDFDLEIRGKDFKPKFKPNKVPTDEDLSQAREELKKLKITDGSYAVSDLYLESYRKELWFSL